MKLSDRVRPDVEAAPWVIEEIEKLQAERDALNDEVELKSLCIKGMSEQADKLAAERDALKDHVHRLESLCHDMAGELTVLRATKQMTAAIDAARGEKNG